jgi:protein ImuB
VQLWLCLRLGELAVQCLPQHPQAVAVVEGQRIHAVNAAASLLGLEAGLDLASARALSAGEPLQLLQRSPDTEAQALKALCCWAYGVTPHLHSFRGDSLMLEISGSLRLFGGAGAILRHCEGGLACRGYSAEWGLAETSLAAWLFSRSGGDRDSSDRRSPLRERLNPIPLQQLAPLHDQFEALQRSGLRTLGELMALPVAALSRRCGQDFVTLLQHLSGEVIVPAAPYEPPSCFMDSYPLGYPVSDHQELGPALESLLQSLEGYLRQRQLHTRQLHWHFTGQGKYREVLEVRASEADNQWQDWYRLTQVRLERQPFREPVETIQLRANQLETARPASGDLFRQSAQTVPTSQLVDLLSNRLGSQAVRSLRCRDAHLPEQSSDLGDIDMHRAAAATPASAQRPFWLLSKPELLRHSRGKLMFWGSPLELIYGPERIEDGWWEQGTSRDYFVAKNAQSQRFWVFHERRQRRWYLQGVFA